MNIRLLPLLMTVLTLSACSRGISAPSSMEPHSSDTGQELSSSCLLPEDCGTYTISNIENAPMDTTPISNFTGLVEDGSPARLQVVSYTVEGDPIYSDLVFDEGVYTLTVDATADWFADPANQSVQTHTYTQFLHRSPGSTYEGHSDEWWLANLENPSDEELNDTGMLLAWAY